EQGEAHEDGRRRPHRRQGHHAQEEEGCTQDGHHGRQEAAGHSQESRGQHHPCNRGGEHIQGRSRHPVLEPQSASFHRSKHMGGQWISTDEKILQLLQDLGMLQSKCVAAFHHFLHILSVALNEMGIVTKKKIIPHFVNYSRLHQRILIKSQLTGNSFIFWLKTSKLILGTFWKQIQTIFIQSQIEWYLACCLLIKKI
ncbi:hypothetical protein ACJX0J_010743, partial [Zea mays]